jgi:hypothetical protein
LAGWVPAIWFPCLPGMHRNDSLATCKGKGPDAPAMTRSDKLLVIILRYLLGIPGLLALVAVFMPVTWMAAAHRWLGLGEMPDAPVVEYLARSLSAMYAVLGAFCLLAATDLERYRPLVRLLAVTFALLGLVLLGIDVAAGLPWWWIAFEGPRCIGVGAVIYFLAGRARRSQPRGPILS